MLQEHPNDAKAVEARIIEESDDSPLLGTVTFEVCFHKPYPFVEFAVTRDNGGAAELLAGARFLRTAADIQARRISAGDRRDSTTIGYRTFMKIAQVMR